MDQIHDQIIFPPFGHEHVTFLQDYPVLCQVHFSLNGSQLQFLSKEKALMAVPVDYQSPYNILMHRILLFWNGIVIYLLQNPALILWND